ncbi:hypothetical protein BSL78_03726 [Apostichopus japonicus]|uniref:Farnesoic acid O-methyl transferase domain-containing protein n=1 Tax=Stichopus japonicus TaxID=307972 RepID=A0A2G8LGH9_STIJA|nr:hypothetical protein BSL78_03726 [Apostichopus japonicus]
MEEVFLLRKALCPKLDLHYLKVESIQPVTFITGLCSNTTTSHKQETKIWEIMIRQEKVLLDDKFDLLKVLICTYKVIYTTSHLTVSYTSALGSILVKQKWQADEEVLIALSPTKGDADGMIEIGIGALENRAIFVRDCRDCSYLKHAYHETDLVNSDTERSLVNTVVDVTIRVFDKEVLEADGDPLFEYSRNDLDETSFNYMGFSGAFITHFHFYVFLRT